MASSAFFFFLMANGMTAVKADRPRISNHKSIKRPGITVDIPHGMTSSVVVALKPYSLVEIHLTHLVSPHTLHREQVWLIELVFLVLLSAVCNTGQKHWERPHRS